MSLIREYPVNYISIENLKYAFQDKGKKRLLIAGFFCARNLGDELMLESLIENIHRENIEITILGSDTDTPFSALPEDYSFIRQPKSRSELKQLANLFDYLIVPGGALIDDKEYSSKAMDLGTIIVDLPFYFHNAGKPYALFGLSSVQRLHNPQYISRLSTIIKHSSYFSVRDTFSKKSLSLSGIDSDNILIVHDIVYAHPVLEKLTYNTPPKSKKSIGLIYVFDDNTYPGIKDLTLSLLDSLDQNVSIYIIPFYDHNDNDVVRAKRLIHEVNDERLRLYPQFPNNFEEVIAALRSVDGIISMRYHGVLIGNLLGSSVVCLDFDTHDHYHNKNLYLYEYYKFPRSIIRFSRINKEKIDIGNLIQSTPSSRPRTSIIHRQAVKQVAEALIKVFGGE